MKELKVKCASLFVVRVSICLIFLGGSVAAIGQQVGTGTNIYRLTATGTNTYRLTDGSGTTIDFEADHPPNSNTISQIFQYVRQQQPATATALPNQPVQNDPLGIERTTPNTNEFSDLIPANRSAQQLAGGLPDFGPVPNGLPAGAWASTLVPVEYHAGLFRDPATRKLYWYKEGKITEETDITVGMSAEELLDFGRLKLRIEEEHEANAEKIREEEQANNALFELQRANSLAQERLNWEQTHQYSPSLTQPDIHQYSTWLTPPVSIYGGSTRIGNTIFHNYSSSDGQHVSGTTMFIGNSAYTDLYGN
jgi:hypothetical protein